MIIVLLLFLFASWRGRERGDDQRKGGNKINRNQQQTNNSVTKKKQFLLDPPKAKENQGGQQMELFNCRRLWNFVVPQAMAGNSKGVTKRNTANKILVLLNCPFAMQRRLSWRDTGRRKKRETMQTRRRIVQLTITITYVSRRENYSSLITWIGRG